MLLAQTLRFVGSLGGFRMRVGSGTMRVGGLVLFVAGLAVGAGAQGTQTGAASGGGFDKPRTVAPGQCGGDCSERGDRPKVAATPPMGWNSWNFLRGR